MARDHPFTIKIEPHIEGSRRFRWRIYESRKLRDQSSSSYATIPAALAVANNVMQKLIAESRIGK
jgi:hypothetical protein